MMLRVSDVLLVGEGVGDRDSVSSPVGEKVWSLEGDGEWVKL